MPIGNSDGQYFEDYQRYSYDLPEENQDKNLSQSGVKQPLKVTITPHMQTGESELGSPDHKVFFVRHGETPENETNTIREKDTMLTDKGRQQAEQAAEKLKEEGVTNLFSSTLPRAQDSANIIAAKLGIIPQFDSRLNTWGMGTLEGQPCSEENLAKIKSHIAETPDKPLGGEESFNDFKDRTFAGIRDSILAGAPGKTAILTHSKVEDALERWNKTGQENPSLDVDAPIKEEKPGSVEPFIMKADSTIMQNRNQQVAENFNERYGKWGIINPGTRSEVYSHPGMFQTSPGPNREPFQNIPEEGKGAVPVFKREIGPIRKLKTSFSQEESIEALARKHQIEGSKLREILLDIKPEDIIGTNPLGMARGMNPGSTVLRDLIKAGKTLKEIGNQFNVTAVAVHKWLKGFGITPNPGGRKPLNTVDIVNRLDRGEVQASIARDLGITTQGLNKHLSDRGLTGLNSSEWREMADWYKN